MVKRFFSFGLALLLSFSFLFYLPNEKVSADEYSVSNFLVGDCPFSEEFVSNLVKSCDTFKKSNNPDFDINSYIPFSLYFSSSNYFLYFFPSSLFNSDFTFDFVNYNNTTYLYLKTSTSYTEVYEPYLAKFRSDYSCYSFSTDYSVAPYISSDYSIYNRSSSSSSIYNSYFLPYYFSDIFSPPELSFSLSPDLTLDMDLDSVQNSLTVSVDNSTQKAYDYMLYVSSTPAATSLTSSLYNMNFASSSKQWCYTKQSDSFVPPDLQQLIKDNASDTFTTSTIIDTLYPGSTGVLFNVWGSQFKAYSEYLSYKEDHITFYSLSQTNCPIYLINREDSRSHVIPFSSFNIEMGKTYYFNIIYREHDQTVVGALGTSTTALLAAGNGQYSYPVYDTSQFTSYQNYCSTEFSVTNGIVSNPQKDDLTDFHSVAYYSNPDNSTAYITNDNSVNINNSFNSGSGSGSGDGGYDPSCSTNYINHGVIYHGCTIYNSPSGSGSGSGSSGSVPDLPEFEFTELYEKSGGFFDFVKLVIENSGWIPVTIFSSLCLVVLFCRIWGR